MCRWCLLWKKYRRFNLLRKQLQKRQDVEAERRTKKENAAKILSRKNLKKRRQE